MVKEFVQWVIDFIQLIVIKHQDLSKSFFSMSYPKLSLACKYIVHSNLTCLCNIHFVQIKFVNGVRSENHCILVCV